MFDEFKKEFSSLKLLTILLTIAVSIYLLRFTFDFFTGFADIIWIFILGWLLSFILEPIADVFTKYLKLPKTVSTVLVFLLVGAFIVSTFLLFIPDIISQFKTLEKVIPQFLSTAPPQFQKGFDNFINSLNNSSNFIPSLTQFFVNVITVLILSFYLVIDKQNINKKIFALSPKKYHEAIRFVQRVIDKSFASFVRLQLLWGVIGGVITYIVLTIFGVHYAASTSLIAGILTSVPMIGPIIGVIPPLLVSIVDKPDQALIIFLAIFLTQQFIFNVIGPKLIGKAFNINPIIVILSLLIGIKVAGFLGAILAIPVISILLVLGSELYNQYYKEREE